MKKNILAENMLRFGAKNLSESDVTRLTELEDPNIAALEQDTNIMRLIGEIVTMMSNIPDSFGSVGFSGNEKSPENLRDKDNRYSKLKQAVSTLLNNVYNGGNGIIKQYKQAIQATKDLIDKKFTEAQRKAGESDIDLGAARWFASRFTGPQGWENLFKK